jgi:hypothetical protein
MMCRGTFISAVISGLALIDFEGNLGGPLTPQIGAAEVAGQPLII